MISTAQVVPSPPPAGARKALGQLWRTSPPLTAVGVLMTLAAIASAVAMLVDPRVITGAPAWLKPFKFAVSTAIYSLTLAWIFGSLTEWRRMRRLVGWTTAVVFVLEVAIIDIQAWRGTTSHFNVSTPVNAVVFATMGAAILLQTFVSVAVAVALWRQRFTDRALGWALRLGMTLTIVGALTGPLMTRPTAAQLADARAGHPMMIAGAHSVGGPDGGPGVPVTGWSREYGDVRVAHFIGLHAIQVLALFALGLRRWRALPRPCASGRSWPRRRATRRSFSCSSGRRSVDRVSSRPTRRSLAGSWRGRWPPSSRSAGSGSARVGRRMPA